MLRQTTTGISPVKPPRWWSDLNQTASTNSGAVQNKLSLYPSVPRIAVPDLFNIAMVGRMSRFFNSLLKRAQQTSPGPKTATTQRPTLPKTAETTLAVPPDVLVSSHASPEVHCSGHPYAKANNWSTQGHADSCEIDSSDRDGERCWRSRVDHAYVCRRSGNSRNGVHVRSERRKDHKGNVCHRAGSPSLKERPDHSLNRTHCDRQLFGAR